VLDKLRQAQCCNYSFAQELELVPQSARELVLLVLVLAIEKGSEKADQNSWGAAHKSFPDQNSQA